MNGPEVELVRIEDLLEGTKLKSFVFCVEHNYLHQMHSWQNVKKSKLKVMSVKLIS